MANFLKNFMAGFKFGGDGGGTALGIDLGSSAIKIVEIKKKGGKAVLETYGAIELGPYEEQPAGKVTNLPVEKAVAALAEVLKQSGAESKSPGFAIPVESSLIFVLELPAKVSESELAAVVPTEARKYIPVPITEVSIDYFILPKKEESFEEMNNPNLPPMPVEKINVLVVATQNDAVARHRAIASGAKLDPAFFEIEIFSSIRANFEHELSPVLLMDLGASRTKLSIVEFGAVKSYHTVDRGGADITSSISASMGSAWNDAEKMKKEFGLYGNPAEPSLSQIIKTHIDYIFSEANGAILAYEKKYNRTVSKVIFTGGGAMMKGITEVASGAFKAEIEIGNPFSKVSAPEFLSKVLTSTGPEFAVAIGLALRKLQ